jgi:hypothetical protein
MVRIGELGSFKTASDFGWGGTVMNRYAETLFQRVVIFLCLLFAIAGAWYVSLANSLSLLLTDDYTWYASLMYMHDAVSGHAPLSLLIPNPFYGLPFWLISFGAAWPFFAVNDDAGVLVAPRMVEVLCGAGSLAVLSLGLRAELVRRAPEASPLWLLAAPVLVLSMPLWWEQAQLIHPQHMLILAELCAAFLLMKDGGRLGRFYWFSIAAVGVALAIKFEAIMLAPMVLGYFLYALFSGEAKDKKSVRIFVFSALLPIAILVALNPYLLTPHGIALWFQTNFAGIAYVATAKAHEHQQAVVGSLVAWGSIKAQISALSKNLLNFFLIITFLAIVLADAVCSLRVRRFSVSVWLAPYLTLCFLLCVFLIKNTQTYYWMTPTVLLLFALVPVVERLEKQAGRLAIAGCACMLVQNSFPGMVLAEMLQDRSRTLIFSAVEGRAMPVDQVRALSREQGLELSPYLRAAKRAMISPLTNLDYKSFGQRYLEPIYGCLSQEALLPTEGRIPKPAVDLVVLRKNDKTLNVAECQQTMALIAQWKQAGSTFAVRKETKYLIAFGRTFVGTERQ